MYPNNKGFGVLEGVLSTALASLLVFFISMQLHLYQLSSIAHIQSTQIEDARRFVRERFSCANTLTDAVKVRCNGLGNYVAVREHTQNAVMVPEYSTSNPVSYIGANIALRAVCATDASDGFYTIKIEASMAKDGYEGTLGGMAFASNPLTKKAYAWQDLFSGVPLTCAKAAAPVCLATTSPVALDSSFGAGGKVTRRIGWARDLGYDLKVQSGDDKIILGGHDANADHSHVQILRFNPDGTKDIAFGSDGYYQTRIPEHPDTDAFLHHLALQTDGKILFEGHNRYDAPGGYRSDAFIAGRLLTSGTPDNTFGTLGQLMFNPTNDSSLDEFGWGGIFQQPDGKIVMAGALDSVADSATDPYQIGVFRFSSNGTLDTSFNSTGKVVTDVSSGDQDEWLRASVLQPDGKIISVGKAKQGSYSAFLVIRLNTNGKYDTSFGGTGQVLTSIGSGHDMAYGVGLQSDGKIVVVGTTQISGTGYWVVARYLLTGALDTSFNGTGINILNDMKSDSTINKYFRANRVLVLNDGRIAVSGSRWNGTKYEMALSMLTGTGALDLSFNGTGYLSVSIGGRNDFAYGLDMDSKGRLVLGGWTETSTGSDFALVRTTPVACP